ncbi:aminoglycoside phosphotransferase [Bacillus phage Mgbh1]|uniref:Aminoglycoside phosphotransferase n=1 Tax=Bacillus phage Mgbh1 TaxID=1796993 RepID=A0A142F1L1_9CAUD|nr:aminoglycoside phosphotransferase [Bacillus phage Mgbh1]AMQ66668.1 aminoglycoside phosphotransferase [Bacillus phage Mgbh1]
MMARTLQDVEDARRRVNRIVNGWEAHYQHHLATTLLQRAKHTITNGGTHVVLSRKYQQILRDIDSLIDLADTRLKQHENNNQ